MIATFGGTALGDIALVPAPFLKHPKGIRDITEWYVSTSSRQDYVHKVFERQCEIALENLEKIYAAIGDIVQAVFICGTDFGTQTSAFCSVKTFNNLYFPYYKKVNDWIHSHTQWKTFKHSCGAVSKFLPSFIEAGIDILNPVQCSATGMDPEQLKANFGDRLVFWGGGVDTQKSASFRNACSKSANRFCADARSSRRVADSFSTPFIMCRRQLRLKISSPCSMPCTNSTGGNEIVSFRCLQLAGRVWEWSNILLSLQAVCSWFPVRKAM